MFGLYMLAIYLGVAVIAAGLFCFNVCSTGSAVFFRSVG